MQSTKSTRLSRAFVKAAGIIWDATEDDQFEESAPMIRALLVKAGFPEGVAEALLDWADIECESIDAAIDAFPR